MTYTYPYAANPVCEGSGTAAPVGSVTHGEYTDCRFCGRRVYVHAKGALAKHSARSSRTKRTNQ